MNVPHLTRAFPNVRELLTADRTYYVRSDGSDSNDGLTNSSGGAFLTIQQAVDVAATLDFGGYDVTAKIGTAGTYAGCGVNGSIAGSGGSFAIEGDTSSPGSYVISSAIQASDGAAVIVRGVDFTSSNYGLLSSDGTILVDGAVIFGACTSGHMYCERFGTVYIAANYTIDGNAPQHHYVTNSGFIYAAAITVTLTGTPAFTTFAVSEACSVIQANSNTYSGSATGARYSASLNGVIRTLGGGASYFPGNSAGSTATGGQYS